MAVQRALKQITKDPDERKNYSASYTKWLEAGETLTDVAFSVVPEGLADEVTALSVASSAINTDGNAVSFYLVGGTADETYKLYLTATTSTSQIKQDYAVVVVRDL